MGRPNMTTIDRIMIATIIIILAVCSITTSMILIELRQPDKIVVDVNLNETFTPPPDMGA
jgi:hypothetical protein